MKRYIKPAMEIVEIEGGAVLYESMSIADGYGKGGGDAKSSVFDLDGWDKDEAKGSNDNAVWE